MDSPPPPSSPAGHATGEPADGAARKGAETASQVDPFLVEALENPRHRLTGTLAPSSSISESLVLSTALLNLRWFELGLSRVLIWRRILGIRVMLYLRAFGLIRILRFLGCVCRSTAPFLGRDFLRIWRRRLRLD